MLYCQERNTLSTKCDSLNTDMAEAELAIIQLKSDLAIADRERRELEEVRHIRTTYAPHTLLMPHTHHTRTTYKPQDLGYGFWNHAIVCHMSLLEWYSHGD